MRLRSRPATKPSEDCVSGLKLVGIGTERLELIAIEEELLTASSGKVRKEAGGASRVGALGSFASGSCEALVSAEIEGSECGAGGLLKRCSAAVDCWALAVGAAAGSALVGGAAEPLAGSLF